MSNTLSTEAIDGAINDGYNQISEERKTRARDELAALKARIAELEAVPYERFGVGEIVRNNADRERELFETARMIYATDVRQITPGFAYQEAEILLAERDRRRSEASK